MRLIDADKEIQELKAMKVEGETFTTAVNFAIKCMESAPTVDPSNVVLCKWCRDCKTHYTKFKGEPIAYYSCTRFGMGVEDDDFCCWGEWKSNRKERQ